MGRHRRAPALPRRRRPEPSSTRFPSPSAATRATSGFYEAPLADGATRAARRLPGAVRSRRPLRRRQHRLPGQPAALCVAGARRARIRRRDAAPDRRRARARLAGGARAGLSARRSTRRIPCSAARRASSRSTTSPIRGCSSRTGCRARSAAGSCSRSTARVLGPISFLKGGINDARRDHDGQPALRRRRSRRRSSASASTASSAPRAADLVGILNGIDTASGIRRAIRSCRRRYDADDLAGQARREGGGAGALRPAGRRRGAGAAARRHGLADGRSEGARSDRRASPTTCRSSTPRSSCSAPASRAIRTCGARSPRAHPDRIGVRIGFDESLAHLIEGGRRPVPDAVAVRAVRPEPDVQPALRHGAGRARRRRARRHGDRLRAGDAAAATGFMFEEYTPGRRCSDGAAAGRWRLLRATGRRWRALQVRRRWQQDYSLGPFGAGSTSEYIERAVRHERQRIRTRSGRARGLDGTGTREKRWQPKTCRPLRTGTSRQRAEVGRAGARGLLGGVVRPVQAARADGRRAGDRVRRQGDRRQAERRREPEHRRSSSRFAASRRCCSSRAARWSSRSSGSRRRTTSRRSSTSTSENWRMVRSLMSNSVNVIIIGLGPAGPDRRPLRRARQPAAARSSKASRPAVS